MERGIWIDDVDVDVDVDVDESTCKDCSTVRSDWIRVGIGIDRYCDSALGLVAGDRSASISSMVNCDIFFVFY
jgi:hypothetical protein